MTDVSELFDPDTWEEVPGFDFTDLTPAERAELAMALWDSLPVDSPEPPLTPAQRAELARRVEGYRRDPVAGASWDQVRDRIRGRSRYTP
jgi:putative addiction module component (TIGR02574 family)